MEKEKKKFSTRTLEKESQKLHFVNYGSDKCVTDRIAIQ